MIKHTNFKKISLIILIIMFSLSLFGCADTREIDQRTIVIGMGLDKTEEDEYIVTLQVPILVPNGATESGTNDFETITGKGEFVWEAITNLEASTPTVLFFGHLKAIAIGERLATEGMDHIIDLLDRRAPLANEVFLLIIRKQNDVHDFLNQESPLISLPALYIDRFFGADQKVSRTKSVRLFQFRRDHDMVSHAATIPLAYSNEDSIFIEDLGVFHNFKLVGELKGHEAGVGMLLKDKKVDHMNYSLDIEQPNTNLKASIRVNLVNNISYDKTNPVKMNFNINGKGELVYLYPEGIYSSQETLNKIVRELEKEISQDITDTINKMKRLNVEPWLLGHRIWAMDTEYFSTLNWNETGWRDAEYDVSVNVEIEQTGQRGMLDKKKIGD
ncbi:Ger(x)C family spore germination protein [Evansella sp. AB-P1]|uniref:Ger(x)C family spore germination protein n=1 Tax=Evansella sp. AB-P1 TaxID=3037653 RepID=UPI00241CE25F|nr:Ger(x)C family spore germination protein [Evansella sp. AB-P1]MDG5788453.1 Ger(x)C family spore germination protein [Evansella sp. AB-P1]